MAKTITETVFFSKVLPCITSADPRACTFKRVVPFKMADKKTMAVGVFESELNKHVFMMLVDPKVKTEMHSLYQGIYYIPPALNRSSLVSDQRNKYQIPITLWELKADIGTVMSWIDGPDKHVAIEFDKNIPKYEPPKEEPPKESADEYNEINPDHYKAEGVESIDVINAFFKDSFNLGNAFKYMARCGKKPGTPPEKDLKKTIWYLFNELKTHMSAEDMKQFIIEEIQSKHLQ